MEHLYDLPGLNRVETINTVKMLENNLVSFSMITGNPVSFFSLTGKHLWSTLPGRRVCDCNSDFGKNTMPCARTLLLSMQISQTLPDVYMFTCNAGLIKLCAPLRISSHIYGYLMAGPMAMGTSINRFYQDFAYKTSDQNIDYSMLMPILHDMKLYSPREITYLSTIFQSMLSSVTAAEQTLVPELQRHDEQESLSRQLIELNKSNRKIEYPYKEEEDLVLAVTSGDRENCAEKFLLYINSINIFEMGRISSIKLRLIALVTQIMRSTSELSEKDSELRLLEGVNDAETFTEIQTLGREILMELTKAVAEKIYTGSSSIISKASSYINGHFKENITLKMAADEIHVNSTYLSTLFKQEMNQTFIEYLNSTRLSHAEKLLRTTNLPVTEISYETGFSASGYFTKVFKGRYHMTPTEYRKSHT